MSHDVKKKKKKLTLKIIVKKTKLFRTIHVRLSTSREKLAHFIIRWLPPSFLCAVKRRALAVIRVTCLGGAH